MIDKEEIEKLTSEISYNDKAFAKLYSIYFSKIIQHLMPKVGNNTVIAEDLTSSAFEKAFLNRGRFRWQGISFSSWIYRIANNVLIDYYRKSSTKLNKPLEDKHLQDKTNFSIEEGVMADDLTTYMQTALLNLSKREREIINLKFYEGFTNKAIAEELGLSETNVSTILYRAINKIRKHLN